MKRIYIWLLIIVCSSCSNNFEDLKFLRSRSLTNGVILDSYTDASGVHGSTLTYYFITDGESFNMFVARISEEEGALIEAHENGVYVNLYSDYKRTKLIDSSFFEIEELRKEQIMDMSMLLSMEGQKSRNSKKYMNESGEANPHWVVFPNSHPYSIIWKQGAGEEFVSVFIDWFDENCTTETERINYFLKHDPPPRWLGFVAEMIWGIEPEGDYNYEKEFKILNANGFKGVADFESDFIDERWLDNFKNENRQTEIDK